MLILSLLTLLLLSKSLVFAWGAAFSPNAASLLIFRFLVGFFGSSSINNVPASIGDFTIPITRGRKLISAFPHPLFCRLKLIRSL